MPNIWTHLIFGQEVLKRTGHDQWLGRQETRNLFHLGCQGPDPLFYRNFWPWTKDKRMKRLGSMMHEEECGPFLMEMFRRIKGSGPEEPALVYASGFLLHHVLDRNAHPYIFVKSGFKPWDHQRFEVILDTIVAKALRGIETWKTPVWRELFIGEKLPDAVAAMMDELAGGLYPELYAGMGSEDWHLAYREMIAAQKLFHDPYGIKRVLTAGKIEPMVYKKKNAPLDYCNEARAVWFDPTDREAVYDTSFWDHWEAALAEGEKVLAQALRYVTKASSTSPSTMPAEEREQEQEQELARLIGNVSYSTGRECGKCEIRYADPIL